MKIAFTLNGRNVFPNYSEGIALQSNRQGDERFRRTELSESLTFVGNDYDWIVSQPFDTKFVLAMDTGSMEWEGVFWKTDCDFNADDKTCVVTPEPYDYYKDVLDGYEKEYDLVKLAPASVHVGMYKRQILQVYAMSDGVGDRVLTNFVGTTAWEQDIQVSYTEVTHEKLTEDWKFAKVAETMAYKMVDNVGDYTGIYKGDPYTTLSYGDDPIRFLGPHFSFKIWLTRQSSGGGYSYYLNSEMYYNNYDEPTDLAVPGSANSTYIGLIDHVSTVGVVTFGDTDSVANLVGSSVLYARVISGESRGSTYSLLPADDIIPQNLNYQWTAIVTSGVNPYVISSETQSDPTEWGQNSIGEYFVSPGEGYAPVSRSLWSPLSLWVSKLHADTVSASIAAEEYILKDAYPIEDAINTLLGVITADSDHPVTFSLSDSDFLSGESPLREDRRMVISQLTNVKKTYYQNAAQTGKITLKQILDMLRQTLHLYWHIDSEGAMHIEHISWYMNGGTYSADSRTPAVDLTAMVHPRNFKTWDFGTNRYTFDKVRLPERIELSYASSQTEPFNGLPIQYVSGYVRKGQIDRVSVSNFYSDVDWLISGASGTGDEGWVVLDAGFSEDEYQMSVLSVSIADNDYSLQNGYMSFAYLEQTFFSHDMSAPSAVFGNTDAEMDCESCVRAKAQQVEFPCTDALTDFDLVKTGIGVGEIENIEYKLKSGSAKASLKLPTEDE